MSSALARRVGQKRSHLLLELTWAATVEISRSSRKRQQKDHVTLLGENQESESAFYLQVYIRQNTVEIIKKTFKKH